MSASKETNGQNTRYANAARRHGADKRVTKAFAIGSSDPAGVVARFQAAAEKSPDLRIRSAANPDLTYLKFPHDLVWGKDDQEIRRLIEEADVVHLNNSDRAVRRFRIHKPMLIHHHGTMFRENSGHFLSIARMHRMVSAVSTIDLLRLAPEGVLHWLPTAYPIAELRKFGKAHRRPEDGRILIAHAPTNREFKHTAIFEQAIRELRAEGLPVDVDIIEGVSNAECMERKARADVVFDQLAWGYGCNAVEAWGMGIPVISGADEWTDGRMREMWGDTPYLASSPDALLDDLRTLVKFDHIRQAYAERGMAHVLGYHDEKPALARLAELYALAIRRFVGTLADMDHPVRFIGPAGKSVTPYVGGPRITFTEEPYETTHPYIAQGLRRLSRRPVFGIEEVA